MKKDIRMSKDDRLRKARSVSMEFFPFPQDIEEILGEIEHPKTQANGIVFPDESGFV